MIAAGVLGSVSKLSGGKFANGFVTGGLAHLLNAETESEPPEEKTPSQAVTRTDDGDFISFEDSKSGFQINNEVANRIFEKLGLPDVPTVDMINDAGLILADEMLFAAYDADVLIDAAEPSPWSKFKAMFRGGKLIIRGLTNEARSHWLGAVDDLNFGLAVRGAVKYDSLNLMYRYRELPR